MVFLNFILTNLYIYLFQHRALHYNLHYLHNFTYIIDKRVLKWTTLQYNIWTTYNTVHTLVTILYNFSFFFLLNTIFSTMKILTATTNTLLLTIYTQNKTQDKRTQKQRGWVGTYLGQSMLWVNIGQKLVPFPKMFCKDTWWHSSWLFLPTNYNKSVEIGEWTPL